MARRLVPQSVRRVMFLAWASAGMRRARRRAKMAMTTRNSRRVKARRMEASNLITDQWALFRRLRCGCLFGFDLFPIPPLLEDLDFGVAIFFKIVRHFGRTE